MIVEFKAHTDLHPRQILIDWTWLSAEAVRPGLRLRRQQKAYAQKVGDGRSVVNLAALFRLPDTPWGQIETSAYVITNTADREDMIQLEVSWFFAVDGDAQPSQVRIDWYDTDGDTLQEDTVTEISRVEQSVVPSAPWGAVTTYEIFVSPGGEPEIATGRIRVFTSNANPAVADRVEWLPGSQPPVTLDFDIARSYVTTAENFSTGDSFQARFNLNRTSPGPLVPVGQVVIDETFNPDSGDWKRRVQVVDGVLEPEKVYYYALFAPESSSFSSRREWRAAAMATRAYELGDRLYHMLPAVHRQYDEPTPDMQGQGQLRRFLSIFGQAADQVRSMAEGLRNRHDVNAVDADFLWPLARWIGWQPDQTLDEKARRRDIHLAPEIYQSVGTLPNIRALVNRMTGWDCQVKEYVHNIFRTNAPEIITLWEIWERHHDGSTWSNAVAATQTDGFDGRPSAAVDISGNLWLFWHADRSGRREIWLQRMDGVDPAPRRAMLDTPDDAPGLRYIDEYPAAVVQGARVWLFFGSNRSGMWEIWARPYDGLPGGTALQLTEHSAEDRAPAAVVDSAGQIWVFWQSNRRGPTDIWARVFDGSDWSLPQRVTSAVFRHETPAAVVDSAGRIWLFWSNDQGDRRNLYVQINDGGTWNPPEAVTAGRQRDEAPQAIFFNGQIWLFWHSDRNGFWQVWAQIHDGIAWGIPFAVTSQITADKEPAAAIDSGGNLRLFWRSQRRGRDYQSRTVDTEDPVMIAQLKTFQDRTHYTYHTGSDQDAWYGRGTVGLYLTPTTAVSTVVNQTIARTANFVDSFRPLPVRFIWQTQSAFNEDVVPTDGLITENFFDEIE